MRGSIRSDLIKQLRRPSDLYRGTLAEDYDGIGQYVLVSMSRGSTAAALRARIASGDFGGSRVFPVGTPIVMHSAHGQLEVLSLGNLPRRISCFIVDYFTDRTFSPGLGVATSGPTWSNSGPDERAISVNPTDGAVYSFNTADVVFSRYLLLNVEKENAPWHEAFVVKYNFKVDEVPTGASNHRHFALILKEFYSKHFDFFDSGVKVSAGALEGAIIFDSEPVTKTDWIADSWYTYQAEIIPTGSDLATVNVKVWAESELEPSIPQLTLTDRGWSDAGTTLDERFNVIIDTNLFATLSPAVTNIGYIKNLQICPP